MEGIRYKKTTEITARVIDMLANRETHLLIILSTQIYLKHRTNPRFALVFRLHWEYKMMQKILWPLEVEKGMLCMTAYS